MSGLLQHLPDGWSATGLGEPRSDGVNTYYQAHLWQIDGTVNQRTLLQVQMQYYHPSRPTTVHVTLNGQRIDTLTFPPAIYQTQTSAVFINPGTNVVGVIPDIDTTARLYFPDLKLSVLQQGRSDKVWGVISWNLNGDLGAPGRSALQVDGQQTTAHLDDRAWTVPLVGGMPISLNYHSVAFGGPYQVEWTALGAGGRKVIFAVPPKTLTLPKHVAEESVELPAWTTALQARAVCANASNSCYPVQLIQADVFGPSAPQKSAGEGTLAMALAFIILAVLFYFLFWSRS